MNPPERAGTLVVSLRVRSVIHCLMKMMNALIRSVNFTRLTGDGKINELIKELASIPSYDLECHGYHGDELIRQTWPIEEAIEYLQINEQLPGDWVRSSDVIELLKAHGLI